ncbi:hypothetical protein [Halodesulfurarchaeum formicicum]|uniref:Uncharacterized protein n=1 Tax=Halodesulfurarchaeum formicicum TaxID=1873524 RepID=A0A1J1ABB4_9EURY|nr:hypothetical protein [Halodesulfurarchaeum formicicum]APE95428.1 hypothetical protein HSR6_0975 [Halodesulfurarchaeum formicicum]
MSVIGTQADSQDEIRKQLERVTEPHETSAQAIGDPEAQNHNDGQHIRKRYSYPPFHKWLAKADRHGASVARFPQAFVDPLLYTTDRDRTLLRQLAGEVDYDFRDPHPSHEALERYHPERAKVFEWLADDPSRAQAIRAVKGTDFLMHGEPGGGKSSLALSLAAWRMEVNNETVIWAETVDESGTNERTEWLPFAPFATLAIPAGLDTRVRIVPEDVSIQPFEVDIETIARDVIRYESIQDLTDQLIPGQFYVVFPDPLHRGAEEVSHFNYWNYRQVTPKGEDGPDEPTDADQWWFAFIAHRISGDTFPHPTFINLDEAGNILDADASKDVHQHYQKIRWFRDKYADARKKGVTFAYQAHALSEIHKFARQKIRWRVTMPGNSPPLGRKLPGDRRCPLEADITSRRKIEDGAEIWKAPNFATVTWMDLKGKIELDAEVSIDFLDWQRALGGSK